MMVDDPGKNRIVQGEITIDDSKASAPAVFDAFRIR